MSGTKSARTGRVLAVLLTAGAAMSAAPALAQPGITGAGVSGADAVAAATTHRSNLARMFRPITTEFTENRLEDVMKFIEDYTGATLEVHWAEGGGEGLNRDQTITMKVRNLTAMKVLERVLAKAAGDIISGGNTWQMTEYGAIEVGPKSVLNKAKRVELYDIHDLLLEIPTYDEVPQIDLQSLLRQAQQGGGGGGQSPFTNDRDRQNRRENQKLMEDRGVEIIRLITSLVEPEEWLDNGGEGGTARYYNGNILVNAPDYMHRQIVGYSYWPSHTASVVGGRRYVSLNMDNSIGTIDGITNYPVTAVVPGAGGGGGTGPGGPVDPGGKAIKPTTPITAPKPAEKSPAKPEKADKPDKKK